MKPILSLLFADLQDAIRQYKTATHEQRMVELHIRYEKAKLDMMQKFFEREGLKP